MASGVFVRRVKNKKGIFLFSFQPFYFLLSVVFLLTDPWLWYVQCQTPVPPLPCQAPGLTFHGQGPGWPEVIPDVEIILTPPPPPPFVLPPCSSPPGPGQPLHQGWQRPLGQRLSTPEHMTCKAAPPSPPPSLHLLLLLLLLLSPRPHPPTPILSSTSGAHYRGDSKSEGGAGSLRAERAGKRVFLNPSPLKHPPFPLFYPFSLCFSSSSKLPSLPSPLTLSLSLSRSLMQWSLSCCQCHMITNTLLMSGFGKELGTKKKKKKKKKKETLRAVGVKYCTAVNSVWFGWTTKRMSRDVEFPRKVKLTERLHCLCD